MTINDAIKREEEQVRRKNVPAQWIVKLLCVCPCCKEDVDLLDYPDFWDCRELDIPEHGTERSRGQEVICPECNETFTINCEY